MKKLLLALFISFCLITSAFGGTYTVTTGTTTVDGDTFCGGVCDSSDIIEIASGTRGNIIFQDFDGNGSYITIRNVSTGKVTINTGGGYGAIELKNCSYIDLRGDNYAGATYGILLDVVNEHGVYIRMGAANANADHIKVSYLEYDGTGTGTQTGWNAFMLQDKLNGDQYDIWDTIEIHHNYIHDTGYAGVYGGHSDFTEPRVRNVSIHHNIFEDIGSYAATIKGSDSGVSYFYENQIYASNRASGKSTGQKFDAGFNAFTPKNHGLQCIHFTGGSYCEFYNNWIEKTEGNCIKIGDSRHQIYNNVMLGCGVDNEPYWGHAMSFYNGTNYNDVYDNIVLEPVRYAFYSRNMATGGATLSRNKVGEVGIGHFYNGDFDESSPPNDDIVESDIDSFSFPTWSDDDNYSNDDFGSWKYGEDDTTAPYPNPATISSVIANSSSQLTINATAQTDATPPVYTQFVLDNTDCGANAGTGGTGCTYQESDACVDSGLDVNQCYGFYVQHKDSVGTPNVGTASGVNSTYTLAAIPGTITFENEGASSVEILAHDENGNPSANPATTFAIQCVSTSPADANWENKWIQADGTAGASAAWLTDVAITALTISGMDDGTLYGFRSKARNGDSTETALGTLSYASTTGAPTPPPAVTGLGIVASGCKFE